MLILLPPSEGKTRPRRGKPLEVGTLSFPALHQPRVEVLDALVALCSTPDPVPAAQVLGLGPTQLEEVRRNARLASEPTARVERVYSGVLYDALDLASLDGGARRRAGRWLAVTSALFGLVRPADRIPAYRLSGGTALPGIGSVARFWGRHLGPAVAAASGGGLVVDLRSTAYLPCWRPAKEEAARVASVRVLQESAGRRTVVSHHNKATKGRLVRALLTAGATPRTPGELATAWQDLGWHVELPESAPGRPQQLDVVVTDC